MRRITEGLAEPSFSLVLMQIQRDIPEISVGEVLVRVTKTGICGSDVHYLHHGRIGTLLSRSQSAWATNPEV